MKCAAAGRGRSLYLREKIRPRWDWNERKELWLSYRIFIRRKSDQGGIEMRARFSTNRSWRRENQTKVGLKSTSQASCPRASCMRKSDQGGIEIRPVENEAARPAQRKSDQGGIEMHRERCCVLLVEGENQTKVGLKYFAVNLRFILRFRENQTKVGLK